MITIERPRSAPCDALARPQARARAIATRRPSRWRIGPVLLLALTACGCSPDSSAPRSSAPPFAGTIYIDPDIITAQDPSALDGIAYAGRAERTMYDRRGERWTTVEPYLFDATYRDGLRIEVQVNAEFGSLSAARAHAERFALVVGRLPKALRTRVATLWIHDGKHLFGGGNDNLLIHVEQADEYDAQGILEETLVHEAVHTSLDPDHRDAAAWIAAQRADPRFISEYAREHPEREDLAESFVPYLAVRLRADRIDARNATLIRESIPDRIAYLDSLGLDLRPLAP